MHDTPSHAHHGPLRYAVGLSYANALLWALGNGLVSTMLVTYLALELGAQGIAISLIYASPRFAGSARVVVPALIAAITERGWGGRKHICIVCYALSALVLVAVPAAAFGAGTYGYAWGITTLVAAWCGYHLLEYMATIALWSWLGDLYPERSRSRLIGARESFLVTGRVVGIGFSLLLAGCWRVWLPEASRWAPLAASASVGALLMLSAVVPLFWMPALSDRPSALPEAPWRTLRRALAERAYRRLLTYSCVLGFANGLTGSAQGMYPRYVLGIGYEPMVLMRALMYSGQALLAPLSGLMIDRGGAKRVMFIAQLITATGPLFFLWAQPAPPAWAHWLIVGAFVVWVAYAPLNVGLDTLKLGLADARNNAPFLSVYHALSEFSNAVSLLLGGLLYETLRAGGDPALYTYAALFFSGWVLRTLTAGLILRLEED